VGPSFIVWADCRAGASTFGRGASRARISPGVVSLRERLRMRPADLAKPAIDRAPQRLTYISAPYSVGSACRQKCEGTIGKIICKIVVYY